MTELLELALYAILNAATAVGAIQVFRVAPVIRGWNEAGVKPWACDLCMSFWVTLSMALLGAWGPLQWGDAALWSWMAAFALAYTWTSRITPMPDAFVGLPDEPPTASPSGPDDRDESE